jgi:hypothetical protein
MEECPLEVRSVAAALSVSPTTLYKYGFNREINAAEQCRRENGHVWGWEIERRSFHDQVHGYRRTWSRSVSAIKRSWHVSRLWKLTNDARLGFDPEEMYSPILKPKRTTSRTGSGRHGSRSNGRQGVAD